MNHLPAEQTFTQISFKEMSGAGGKMSGHLSSLDLSFGQSKSRNGGEIKILVCAVIKRLWNVFGAEGAAKEMLFVFKAISLVILELFFWFPDGFCHSCPSNKEFSSFQICAWIWETLWVTKLYAQIIPIHIFGPFQEYEAIYLAKLTIQMMSPLQLERSLSVPPGSTGEKLLLGVGGDFYFFFF